MSECYVKRVAIAGPPGGGKGTQAKRILETLKVPHVPVGDRFREEIKNQTPLGLKAKAFIDAGTLVPDSITVPYAEGLLLSNECKDGWVVDGYPRTLSQADAFIIFISGRGWVGDFRMIVLEAGLEDVLARNVGRLSCECGESFHVVNKLPKEAGICDVCGRELFVRKDDKEETIRRRFKEFNEQTMPGIERIRQELPSQVAIINGKLPIEMVSKKIMEFLKRNDHCKNLGAD